MNENSWIYKNEKGATLEIFKSEREGFYVFIYTAKSGDVYSPPGDIHESQKNELKQCFMAADEEKLLQFSGSEKGEMKGGIKKNITYNLIGFSILVLFFVISLFR